MNAELKAKCINPTKSLNLNKIYDVIPVKKSNTQNKWEHCNLNESSAFEVSTKFGIIRIISKKRFEIMDNDLKEYLESEGYKDLREIPGRGICGLKGFMFTVGLCYGLDELGYEGRYCYSHADSYHAIIDLNKWDGNGDPKGKWIKHKGRAGEWSKVKTL